MGRAAHTNRHFERHTPKESEVLDAIRDFGTVPEFWASLAPFEIREGFEGRLKEALESGSFRRVPVLQLTRGIQAFPGFQGSPLGMAFPSQALSWRNAGQNGFLAVHRAFLTGLHFGFVGSFDRSGVLYFREPGASNVYTALTDAHYPWPQCIRPDVSPPSSPFLYFRP